MADFTTTYREVETNGEQTSGRRRDLANVDGPASFLALAVGMGVPIISRVQPGASGSRSIGGGLSFAVARTNAAITLEKGFDWANETPKDWFDRVQSGGDQPDKFVLKNQVNKRILPARGSNGMSKYDQDANTFFAVSIEVRILAREAIRKSSNIVSLIALSWNTRETSGRSLPEILLEGAQHGSLRQYLQVQSTRLDFRSKALMVMDLAAGLAFLHENGIVHRDIKPDNLLVCDSLQRMSLQPWGMAPVILKLCDFGCSVIISDYNQDHMFSQPVGTPGWMAPEVEQGLPVNLELLFKTDLYSLGLVAAQIFRSTRLSPSPSSDFMATPTEVSFTKASKRKHDETDEGDESIDRPRILAEQPGPSMQGATKSDQVPGASSIASLEGRKSNLLRDILSCTLQAKPSDRRDARAIYNLCQDGLLHNCDPRDTEVFRSVLPGCPIGEAKALSAKSQLITSRVPDLAFETSLRPGLLPRQCHMEIVKDFQRRVDDGIDDAGSCALQLAALILNGYLMCEYDQIGSEVEKHLTTAVRLGDPLALLGTINILQALGRGISPEIRQRVLDAFEDPEFQLQAVADIKGLLLPLSFDPATRMTSAAQFPLDEKSTIQTKLIGLRTWKREFPESFAAFLDSQTYRQITAVFPLTRLVPQNIDWQDPISLELGTSIVREYIYTSGIRLDVMCTEERDAFVDELLEKDMVNSPTELGMTLLQLTVLRNDLSMASLLLETLSADTEAYGLTPRCSPLWLACYLGHADMATLLIGHGADLTCSDSLQELTVLHLLTQFSTEDAVHGIGYSALAAGVDINARSDTHITPLLAALLTFDFSDGVAVAFLLDNGADPLKHMVTQLEGFIFPASPLTLCTFHLDADMLQQMLAVIPPGTQETLTNRGGSEAMARQELGFQLMRSQTAFAAMFETGWRYRDNLRPTLKRVIDAERSHLLWMNPPVEPAVYAFDCGRPDLMDVLLDLDHSVVMEKLAPDGSGRRIILLHEAVLQHNVRSVDILIRHGTSLLQPTTRFGDTILTWLVKELPDMLPVALKHLESLPAVQRGGKTVKQILQAPQLAAAGVFDYLLLHGSPQDIALAETLRIQYGLNHDSIQALPPDTTTLMGALLQSASWDGYEKMAQLRYLISLRPLPRFMMPKGVNLFYVALAMFDLTAAAERLDLLRLLLNAYPDMENLTKGHRHILPVTHRAAAYGHLEIIQLMEEHVKLRHPGNKFPYNYMHLHDTIPQGHSLLSMLDCSRFGITMPEFASTSRKPTFGDKDADLLDMSTFDHMAMMGRREQVYRYLRDQGAVHGWELDGYFISARVLWKNTVHPDELHGFLARATSKCFLDPWEHGPGPGEFPSTWHPFAWREVEKSTDSKALNQFLGLMGLGTASEAYAVKSELTICELVWRGNGFFLQAWDLPFASSCLAEDVAHYFSNRVDERIRWDTNFDGLRGTPPYRASSYREKEEQAVLYTRSGRIWTDEEVCKLSHDAFDEWAVNFGELEDLIPDDLKAVVEPFSKSCLHQ